MNRLNMEKKQYKYRVYDMKSFPEEDKENLLFYPIYNLFKKLYKGHLYDTPDFCYKKMKFDSPSVEEIYVLLMYDNAYELLGVSILKFHIFDFKENLKIGVFEGTNGYLVRSLPVYKKFFIETIRQKSIKYPNIPFYYFGLLTSPSSYIVFTDRGFTYPCYNVEMPDHIKEVYDYLIKQFSFNKDDNKNQEYEVVKGALYKEEPIESYIRFTKGRNLENPHVKYFFQKTKGVMGNGIVVILDVKSYFEKGKILYAKEEKHGTKVPVDPSTDFEFLINLRQNQSLYQNLNNSKLLQNHIGIFVNNQKIISFEDLYNFEKIPNSNTEFIPILFKYELNSLFELLVLKSQFNPFKTLIKSKLIELIMHGNIRVKDKSIIDLGCDFGSIGLCSMLMGATNILFSDANGFHLPLIKNHNLIIAEEHEFIEQDILEISSDNKLQNNQYDMILTVFPCFTIEKNNEIKFVEVQKGFLLKFAKQSSKMLKALGEIIVFTIFMDFNPKSLIEFMSTLCNELGPMLFEFLVLQEVGQNLNPLKIESRKDPKNFFVLIKLTKILHLTTKKIPNIKDYLYYTFLKLKSGNYIKTAEEFHTEYINIEKRNLGISNKFKPNF